MDINSIRQRGIQTGQRRMFRRAVVMLLTAVMLCGCGRADGITADGLTQAGLTSDATISGGLTSDATTSGGLTPDATTSGGSTPAGLTPAAVIPAGLTPTAGAASSPMRRVAYFTSWSAYARGLEVMDMDPSLLTHINFAFANVTPDGEITVGDSWVDTEKPFSGDSWEDTGKVKGHFSQLQKLKKEHTHIKTLISVGGWTWSGNFSKVAASDEGRKRFADSAVRFLTQYGFDGVDIDWEFPVEGGNGIEHRPSDRENYTRLLREVRTALDRQGELDHTHYLLTVAGGPNPSFAANTQLDQMMEYVDFINVMAYDYHGSWEASTGHNAPLYAEDGLCISETISAYLHAGARPDKLNLGLAFYGRGWTGVQDQNPGAPGTAPSGTGYGLGTWESAVFDYWDLEQNYVGKNGYVRYFDEKAMVPYLYNGTVFISYDDPESVRAKLAYAADQGLGGIMFWEFGGDKEKALQRVICEAGQAKSAAADSAQTSDTAVQSAPIPDTSTQSAQAPTATAQPSPWNADTVYQSGDRVIDGGITYRAKWWTQNQEPSSNCQEWGPWEKESLH